MSEGDCRKGGAGKVGLKRKERGEGWSGGWEGRSARCCRGVGRVGVSGGRGAGGRWREGKEDAKETYQILQKNKSTMLDDLGSTEVNPDIFKAQESYICQSFANIFEDKNLQFATIVNRRQTKITDSIAINAAHRHHLRT